MAKGYSVRKAVNYSKRKDGTWKIRSSSFLNEKYYTRIFPTIEEAENFAREKMNDSELTPKDEWYINYCKIYFGKEEIKKIER